LKYYNELKSIEQSKLDNEEKARKLRILFERILKEHFNSDYTKKIKLHDLIRKYKQDTTKQVSIKKFYKLKDNLNHWHHYDTDVLTDKTLNNYFIAMKYIIETVTGKTDIKPSKRFHIIKFIFFWGLFLWASQMYNTCSSVQCLLIPTLITGLMAIILVFIIQNLFSTEKREEKRLRKLKEDKKRQKQEMKAQNEQEERERIKQEEKREKERIAKLQEIEDEIKRQEEWEQLKAHFRKLFIIIILGGVLYYIYSSGFINKISTNDPANAYEFNHKNSPDINNNERYTLKIITNPPHARVQIMNIKPKYHDGITLKKGRYTIRVSKPGYITSEYYVDVNNESYYTLSLDKKSK